MRVKSSGGESGEAGEGVRDLRAVLGEGGAEIRNDAGRIEGDRLRLGDPLANETKVQVIETYEGVLPPPVRCDR